MIMEIQCLANPPGTAENQYAHVEAAIAVIQESGLKYEVDALGTTVEGDPEAIWALGRAVHEACLNAGANSLVTVVKFAQSRDEATDSTIDSLTGKFR
jgi:uncharacterized protein YqgV (UPF0045/DUF77 family)